MNIVFGCARIVGQGDVINIAVEMCIRDRELAALLEKEMKKQEEAMVPAVIPIPGVKGNTGLGIRRLSQSVEKAVGADIIFQ